MQTITFSEQPLGTVNAVYRCKDNIVRFYGQLVQDSAQPNTPVVAHDATYTGPVVMTFSQAVSDVAFDGGYFDALHSTVVSYYDAAGTLLHREFNTIFGVQHFSYSNSAGIARVVVNTVGDEPAGFSVDSVSFTNQPPQVQLSGNQDIDGILWGYKWDHLDLKYSFPTSADEYLTNGYQDVEGFLALTPTQIAACRNIVKNFDAVCGLTFTETQAVNADLRFAEATGVDYSDGRGLHVPGLSPGTAEANPPAPEQATGAWGDAWFSHNPGGNDNSNPQLGNFIYTAAFAHELGHNVGLKHGHASQTGHGVTFPTLPASHNSQEYSIMTYNSYPGGRGGHEFPQTLMQDDIAALQYLYGADYSSNSTDTVYKWDPLTGTESVNNVSQGVPFSNFIFLTIWDGGGIDTYDLSNYTTNLVVNLSPGAWSTLDASQLADLGNGHVARGNVANALLYQDNKQSLIENVKGGSGSDTLNGNTVANVLLGGGGVDTMNGYGGNDTLNGGAGIDTLIGNTGRDIFAFNTTLGAINADHITDFAVGLDMIQLDGSLFAGLSAGVVAASAFKTLGSGSVDLDDRILYNPTTGALFYDSNGSGAAGRAQFATVDNLAAISHSSFIVV